MTYSIVSDAVDKGCAFGWKRAHKHTPEPDEATIRSAIGDAIMLELDFILAWGD